MKKRTVVIKFDKDCAVKTGKIYIKDLLEAIRLNSGDYDALMKIRRVIEQAYAEVYNAMYRLEPPEGARYDGEGNRTDKLYLKEK